MRQHFLALALLIVLGLVGAFISLTNETVDEKEINISSVDITHTFVEGEQGGYGTHTYTGAVDVPNSCYKITAEADIAESFPEQIYMNITLANPNIGSGTVCTQASTSLAFRLEVTGHQDAMLESVRINEEEKSFTLTDTVRY